MNLHENLKRGHEIASKCFAVFNMIIVSVATCNVTATMIYYHVMFQDSVRTPPEIDDEYDVPVFGRIGLLSFVTLNISLMALLVTCVTAFVFAYLLVSGVFKQKPQYVKAYFIFGVVVTCLSVLTTLAYMLLTADVLIASIALVGIFLYTLVLRILCETYRSYENGQYEQNLLMQPEKNIYI